MACFALCQPRGRPGPDQSPANRTPTATNRKLEQQKWLPPSPRPSPWAPCISPSSRQQEALAMARLLARVVPRVARCNPARIVAMAAERRRLVYAHCAGKGCAPCRRGTRRPRQTVFRMPVFGVPTAPVRGGRRSDACAAVVPAPLSELSDSTASCPARGPHDAPPAAIEIAASVARSPHEGVAARRLRSCVQNAAAERARPPLARVRRAANRLASL